MARKENDSRKSFRYSFPQIVLFLLLITGCSQVSRNIDLVYPSNLTKITTFSPAYTPDKVCFTTIDSTFYLLNKSVNKIDIYRKKERKNTIGGTGFDKAKFFKISDIAVAPNGQLLVLDPIQRKIKKFDVDGNWILDIDLSFMQEPTLLIVSEKGQFFIYDSRSQEITTFNEINVKNRQVFGKFQINKIDRIDLAQDFVVLIDTVEKRTIIFNEFGFLEYEYSKIQYWDYWKQSYLFAPYHLQNIKNDKKLLVGITPLKDIFFSEDYVILNYDKKVQLAKINYVSKSPEFKE